MQLFPMTFSGRFVQRIVRLALLFIFCLGLIPLQGRMKEVVPKPANANTHRKNVETIKVRPSETDPAIKTFDAPHYVFVNDGILIAHEPKLPAARRELLLWIPGTQTGESDGPGGAVGFCQLAADMGYHVIILKYPNDKSASVCRDDAAPASFEEFRMVLIEGGQSAHLTLSRTESMEHRLMKLLAYLQRTRPLEEWAQYLDGDSIKWSSLAVAGQSQGGGHAALIGLKHRVARVICFGAPKDYSIAHHAPAAWLRTESATPKSHFFAFNHEQDNQACTPDQQLENLRALGLDAFGPPVDVDNIAPPFRHSHILMTNYPGTKLLSKEAHTMGISQRNEAIFGKVWAYLLTEKAP